MCQLARDRQQKWAKYQIIAGKLFDIRVYAAPETDSKNEKCAQKIAGKLFDEGVCARRKNGPNIK